MDKEPGAYRGSFDGEWDSSVSYTLMGFEQEIDPHRRKQGEQVHGIDVEQASLLEVVV